MDANSLLAKPWLPGVELFHADFSGQAFGRHSHDAFAIGAIVQGVGGYQCRGQRYALPAGTLSLMNPEEPHTGHAESARVVYRMLYIEESRLPALLGRKRLPNGFSTLNPDDDGRVAASLAQLAGEFERGDALALESELLALLELVFVRRRLARGAPGMSRQRGDGVPARLPGSALRRGCQPRAIGCLGAASPTPPDRGISPCLWRAATHLSTAAPSA